MGGHADPELAPEGRQQALRVADRLASEPISTIYVSNLRRTSETAAPLAERLGLEPKVEADLREVNLGDWEGGLFRVRMLENNEIAQRMLLEERWDVIPGAESSETFGSRVEGAIRTIASRHPDQTVAVFCHGGVIGQVLATATGSRPFAFNGADNASISHIVVVGDRWVLRTFNDTAHLHTTFGIAPETPT